MKLMVLSTLYAPRQVGGAEKIAQLLAESLAGRGHACTVVTTRPEPGRETSERNGVRVHAIGLRNLYWPYAGQPVARWRKAAWHLVNRDNPLMGSDIGALLDAERPDVVHTHALTGFTPSAWAAARARSIPVVHTVHDYSLACPKASMYRGGDNCEGQCRGCGMLTRPALRRSQDVQAVVGVSRATLRRHLELGYFEATPLRRVIHNGLPGEVVQAAARRPHARLRLGFIGRLVQPKGIEDLLRALHALDPARCELVVAGRGTEEYERRLRTLAPPHATFAGFVEPDSLYRRIDLLVVPSAWEDPLPTTVIEAMRHGVPAVVSNRGGLPDLVQDGRTGRIYDAGDPDGLRDALQAFIAAPGLAAAMGDAVRERAAAFGIDRMAREYEELLGGVAAAHAPGRRSQALATEPAGVPAR